MLSPVDEATVRVGIYFLVPYALSPLLVGVLYPFYFWRARLVKKIEDTAQKFDSELVQLSPLEAHRNSLRLLIPSQDLTIGALRNFNNYGQKIVVTHFLKEAAFDYVDRVKEKFLWTTMVTILLYIFAVAVTIKVSENLQKSGAPPDSILVTLIQFVPLFGTMGLFVYLLVMHIEFMKVVGKFRSELS